MTFNPDSIIPPGANIKVIGVGGGGGNAINTMIKANLEGVEFIAANTDIQALRFSLTNKKIQLGKELTKGLGAGADPDIGRDAVLEDRHAVQETLAGADMVFVTAGMGGGTGTGGASVVAQIAREMGALTVAVVTKPFNFEGKRRRKHAEAGIAKLRESVDTLITIPNQRLLQVATPELSMIDAFRLADNVLLNAVRGISDIINIPGTVNVDFADVKTVMSSMGLALMGIGIASGENRAVEAARQAISSPLLEDIDIEGATGILINITAGADVSLMEVNEACSIIQEAAHEDANIIFGAVIDEEIGNEIRVTVIATGFPSEAEHPVEESFLSSSSRNLSSSKSSTPTKKLTNVVEASIPNIDLSIKKGLPLPKKEPIINPFIPEPEKAGLPKTPQKKSASSQAFDLTQLTMSGPQPMEPEVFLTEHHPEAPQNLEIEQQTKIAGASLIKDPQDDFLEQIPSELQPPQVNEPMFVDEPDAIDDSQKVQEFQFEDFEPAKSLTSDAQEPIVKEDNQLQQDLFKNFETDELDKKLGEALQLAERLKSSSTTLEHDDDNLDIPAFLRSGMKDLSLS